jgi:flagellar biosynthesis protein FlhA
VIKLRGATIARGELMPGRLLAIDSGAVTDPIAGHETREPAFGLPALWIGEADRPLAQHRNYTVVEPTSVLATHLTELARRHAPELLTRQELHRLIDHLKERSPKLVEDLIPDPLKLGELQNVLQNLLRERVPIRDLEAILETLGDWASKTKDAEVLAEYVRTSLARTICEQHMDATGTLHAVTLDPSLEDAVAAHVERTDRGSYLTMPPMSATRMVAAVREEIESATAASGGRQPVILASPQVRMWVRRLIESALPAAAVLGYSEVVRGVNVRTHGMVSVPDAAQNVPCPVHV